MIFIQFTYWRNRRIQAKCRRTLCHLAWWRGFWIQCICRSVLDYNWFHFIKIKVRVWSFWLKCPNFELNLPKGRSWLGEVTWAAAILKCSKTSLKRVGQRSFTGVHGLMIWKRNLAVEGRKDSFDSLETDNKDRHGLLDKVLLSSAHAR